MQHGERVRRCVRAHAERGAHLLRRAGREVADSDALRLERVVELVVHDAAVAHDHQSGAFTRLRGDRTTTRRGLDAWRAQRVRRERLKAIEVEVVDPAVAPDLLGLRRPGQADELLGCGEATLDEPVGPAERAGGVGREVLHARVATSRPRLPC